MTDIDLAALCEWTRDPWTGAGRTHAAWHNGAPCPYRIAAELLAGRPDPRDLVAEWRIPIDGVLNAKGQVPLSLNGRMHWAAQATAVKRVKAATRNAVHAAQIPHLDHVHVELHYRPGTNRFRDVDNIVATLKPAIDALHTHDPSEHAPIPYDPIIDGDDPRFVSWSPPILHPWVKGRPASLWLVLRSYAATEAPAPTAAQDALFEGSDR